MLPDKTVKKKFKETASRNPEKYYPVAVLKKEGFERKQCKNCAMFFWTVNKIQEHCGDPACSGGFQVTANNPAKTKLSYIGVWKKIVEMLKPRGYHPVKRYPVVARWNPTADFVMASIAAFQPYVITGEVDPPAKKLIIPQFSLRFGDVDNVGITGSHLTGFVMIGQHAFVEKEEWNQEQFFRDIYEFLTIGIGLPKSEITIHEDAWAGGGSFGPCMEFFSRGVELFNQVYTMYEQTPEGDRELKLKVLDMGLGMERIAWFSQGTPNIYEATFPNVLKKLKERTSVQMDHALYQKLARYSAYLNVDEVEDIQSAWEFVAGKMGVSVAELRKKILPMTAIYSIAEHARTLLVALSDGALPGNVGGSYNLRVVFRRAQSFIDTREWDLDLAEVASWHADELKELFPELSLNMREVKAIFEVEKKKYYAGKERAKSILKRILQKEQKGEKDISTETLLELYDSNGINPEVVREEAALLGKKVHVPDNFYSLVGNLHEKREQVHATRRELPFDIPETEKTQILYFDSYRLLDFKATVTKVYSKDSTSSYVILDKTAFYPTSGGQVNDIGVMNGFEVVDVVKQGNVIVHLVQTISMKPGQEVKCKIDEKNRFQLTKHHTATHVINASARRVLGNHVNQVGAKKTFDKASLDITHYESLTDEQMKAIEKEARSIVQEKIKIRKFFLKRAEAEKRYGLNIYQGGAIPGNDLRMVIIGNDDNNIVDVECCGGTHLDNTEEIGDIRLLKSTKLSDGVVRLVYVAGGRADEVAGDTGKVLESVAKELSCKLSQVPARAAELFQKWKRIKKLKGKQAELSDDLFTLSSVEEFSGDSLREAAARLGTTPEHVLSTLRRFKKEISELR